MRGIYRGGCKELSSTTYTIYHFPSPFADAIPRLCKWIKHCLTVSRIPDPRRYRPPPRFRLSYLTGVRHTTRRSARDNRPCATVYPCLRVPASHGSDETSVCSRNGTGRKEWCCLTAPTLPILLPTSISLLHRSFAPRISLTRHLTLLGPSKGRVSTSRIGQDIPPTPHASYISLNHLGPSSLDLVIRSTSSLGLWVQGPILDSRPSQPSFVFTSYTPCRRFSLFYHPSYFLVQSFLSGINYSLHRPVPL